MFQKFPKIPRKITMMFQICHIFLISFPVLSKVPLDLADVYRPNRNYIHPCFWYGFLRVVQICFKIILCAYVCISSQARVTPEGSIKLHIMCISLRICTETSFLKLFSFQLVSWSRAGVKNYWEDEVSENVKLSTCHVLQLLSYCRQYIVIFVSDIV